MHSLFVYGTLRPQQPNAPVMERIGGSWMHLKAMNINVSRLKYIWKMVRR